MVVVVQDAVVPGGLLFFNNASDCDGNEEDEDLTQPPKKREGGRRSGKAISPGANWEFRGANVLSVVPHIVGIVVARGFQNYRRPEDWCRMTRAPDIGSKGYNTAPDGKI